MATTADSHAEGERSDPARMVTEETINWAHEEVGLNYSTIADITGVNRSTVTRWRNQESTPNSEHYETMEDLREFRFLVERVFADREELQQWLHTQSEMLRGRTPISYLKKGELEPLIEALAMISSGAFA